MAALAASFARKSASVRGGSANVELEIRVKCSREAFLSAFAALQTQYGAPSGEISVNAILKNDPAGAGVAGIDVGTQKTTSSIRRIILYPSEQSDYYRKTVVNKESSGNMRTRLSVEEPIGQFASNNSSLLRIKFRQQFKAEKWRVDMTIVLSNTIGAAAHSIPAMKSAIHLWTADKSMFDLAESFAGIGPKVAAVVVSRSVSYELEIEWTNSAGLPNSGDIAAMQTTARSLVLADGDPTGEIMYIARSIYAASNYAAFRGETGIKRIGNQVIALERGHYWGAVHPNITKYYITEKADGIRSILCLHDERFVVATSKGVITVPAAITGSFICDAEEVDGRFYVFDCIEINGTLLAPSSFAERITHLPKVIELAAKAIGPDRVFAKVHHRVNNVNKLEELLTAVYRGKYAYEIDGLIFTNSERGYVDAEMYKWKPAERNTIDFLAVECPAEVADARHGKKLYALMCGARRALRDRAVIPPNLAGIVGASSDDYAPIPFMPSCNPNAWKYYHSGPDIGPRAIVELVRLGVADCRNATDDWKFVKVRTDRAAEKAYFGNDIRTAETTYMNYVNPFPFDNLWVKSDDDYFEATTDTATKAANIVKRMNIDAAISDSLPPNGRVIDEACGRGADMWRYSGGSCAMFMDIDRAAIVELVGRKFSAEQRGGGKVSRSGKRLPAKTCVAVMDLGKPATEISAVVRSFIGDELCDLVVCNFALHYFCDKKSRLENLLEYNASALKKGGRFIYTVMDGEQLLSLDPAAFANCGGKYAITVSPAKKSTAVFGRNVSVKLPFTSGMRDEPIAFVDAINELAGKSGFKVVSNKKMEIPREIQLDEYDKLYISLHRIVVLQLA